MYKRLFEDQKYRNKILEMKYRGQIAELQEREIERAKAVDMLIATLKKEQDISQQNMKMYLDADEERRKLERKLRESEWRNSNFEREVERLKGAANEN